MKKLLLWGIPVLAMLGLVAWRFVERKAVQEEASQQRSGRGAPTVEVATAGSRQIRQTLQSVGNVESPFKVTISPKTSGRIEYLQAREGDIVRAGEVLLRIDPSDLQGAVLQQEAAVAEARARLAQAQLVQGSNEVGVATQVQQKQAEVASAQAQLGQVRQNYAAQVAAAEAQVSAATSAIANATAVLAKENASLRNAQTKLDRVNKLYEKGFIAAQNVDDARTALDVQKGAVDVAKGQVDAAKSMLEVQEQNLLIVKRKGLADIEAARAAEAQAQAALRSATANRSQTPAYRQNLEALRRQVESVVGQLRQAQSRLADTVVRLSITGTVTARKADPGSLATPSTPVLEVQFLDWLFVSSVLPLEAASRVRPGQTATITFDALPGRTFSGPVTHVNLAADPQNRQFGVKVRLDNPDQTLRPGMYARVAIVTGQVDAEVAIPREAITNRPDGTQTVAVLDAENTVQLRTVKLGVQDASHAEVLSGVKAGERVVVLTFNPLRDGQKATVAPPGSQPSSGQQPQSESKGPSEKDDKTRGTK